jgi:dihydroneopterin aldolase
VIGVFDWERQVRQTVSLELEMGTDIRAAAATDDLEQAIDYKAVAKRLIAHVEAARCELVETLAEQCARLVLDEFGVEWLRLKLAKPGAVTGSRAVGVIIERSRHA